MSNRLFPGTAVSPPRDEADPRWVYFKIAVGKYHYALDYLIVDVLRTVVKQISPQKWFFLRMIDDDGLQLRARFLVQNLQEKEEMASHISQTFKNAIYEFPLIPKGRYSPMMGSMANWEQESNTFPPSKLVRSVYEPEFDKYGRMEFLEIVESHFNVSSQIAQSIISAEMYAERSRKYMACALMAVAISTFELPRPRHEFLADYMEFWLRTSPIGMECRSGFDASIERLVKIGFNPLDSRNFTDEESDHLSKWRSSINEVVRACREYHQDNRNFLDNLIFNICHLVNNRIGFSTVEEAYISRIVACFLKLKNE